MLLRRVLQKLFDLLTLFAVFFTPLLFFINSHDQFELPKLTFLAILTVPALLWELFEGEFKQPTPLSIALLVLLVIEIIASLPATSLSWRTSLLGDYENFAGLATFILYLLWFRIFSRHLNREKTEKLLLFNSLAAILSSLYAISQHFGFDFIQWNAESVIATREFASLGNPNFLSAYLAISLPLFLCVALKNLKNTPSTNNKFPFVFFTVGVWGLVFLFLGTPRMALLLHLVPSTTFQFVMRAIGLGLFSLAVLGFLQASSWVSADKNFPFLVFRLLTTSMGLVVIASGLLTTGSRGGFLGAIFGVALWTFLVTQNLEFWEPIRDRLSQIPKAAFATFLVLILALFFLLGHGFFYRLWDSTLHAGQSLATSRLHIWGPGIKMIEANPALGVGLDTFKIAFPYYSGIEFNQIDGRFMSSRMAHNELLQMACTTGLLGLAAYLGVLGAFLFMGWKAYYSAPGQAKWILAAVFASAFAYHIQNLFSFGVAGINLVWFLLLAVVQRSYRVLDSTGAPSPNIHLFGYIEKPFILLLLFLLSWLPLDRLGSDIAFGIGSALSDALKNPDSRTSMETYQAYSGYEIDLMQKAVKLCPLETKYVLYLGLAYEQRSQLDSLRARDWEMEALGCYEKAVQMSPANAYYYNDEGRVYTALSSYDHSYAEKAVQAYGEAVRWNPSSPFFNINWSNALSKAGKEKEAEVPMENAFKLDPNFAAQVLTQMAYDKYRAGDKPKAFEILADALQRNTASAEAYYCRGVIYLQENEKALALKDLEAAKNLNPTPEKNPTIQHLDGFIDQAKN